MAGPSVTYTFANSTTSDATQVNQNFTDLINAATDGTKDYTIAALTCNGTATLKGNVTLGDSSVDDITVTGSLASSVTLKTDNTYSIGAAGVGLAGLFLGNTSKTVKLAAPSGIGSNWTFTFPTSGGNAQDYLETNGSGTASWVTPRRTTLHASNYSLSASVGSSILTITLNGADGNAPSSTNPVDIVFRSSTITSGLVNNRRTTSALTLALNSGASLGLPASTDGYVYVYAMDVSGTVELAAAGSGHFDEGTLQTSTAVSGSATAPDVLYSTSGRASVPIRLLGRLLVNTATFWGTAPTAIWCTNGNRRIQKSYVEVGTGNGYGSGNTRIRKFSSTISNVGTAITYTSSGTNGDSFTINQPGIYAISYADNGGAADGHFGISVNSNQLSTDFETITASHIKTIGYSSTNHPDQVAWTGPLAKGDIVRAHTSGVFTGSNSFIRFSIAHVGDHI